MHWFENDSFTSKLTWKLTGGWRDEAIKIFEQIKNSLAIPLHDTTRIGTLVIDLISPYDPFVCSVHPLAKKAAYGHILHASDKIQIINRDGKILFVGQWKDIPREHLLADPKVFFYLENETMDRIKSVTRQ